MRLSQILTRDRVVLNLTAASKDEALDHLGQVLASGAPGVAAVRIAGLLRERELHGTTGIGHGIALPHARLTGLERPLAAFARCKAGVDFHSLDHKPVHLIAALISPDHPTDSHLAALALLARRLRHPVVREALMGARSRDQIVAILAEEE